MNSFDWIHVLTRPPPTTDASTKPRFGVETRKHEEEERRAHQTQTFLYSKKMVADIVLRTPLSARLLQELPQAQNQLRDVLIMSLVCFMQLVCIVNNGTIENWDNEKLQSRVALAMAVSTSFKFVMDAQPVGSVFCLECVLKLGEFDTTSQAAQDYVKNYVQHYEVVLLNRLNVYKCFFNHYAWAQEAMEAMRSNGKVCDAVAKEAEDLLFFFSYNLVENIPKYCKTSTDAVGPAISLISIFCMASAGFDINTQTQFQHHDIYVMACGMARDMLMKTTQQTQKCLLGVYTNQHCWQSRATEPRNIERARDKLQYERPRAV